MKSKEGHLIFNYWLMNFALLCSWAFYGALVVAESNFKYLILIIAIILNVVFTNLKPIKQKRT